MNLTEKHELLCKRREDLQNQLELLNGEIHEVCKDRAFEKWGVRVGTLVNCPHHGECIVAYIAWFHNLERLPTVGLRREDGGLLGASDEYEILKP